MNSLDLFSNELTNKISCIHEYFIDESDLNNQLTKAYFNRINFKASSIVDISATALSSSKSQVPKCAEFFPLDFNVGLFEHLDAMKRRHKLKMQPELSLSANDLQVLLISSSNFPSTIYNQLKSNPHSWKLYTLTSYYWRLKGNALQAIGKKNSINLLIR
jgi:hypothetical protein